MEKEINKLSATMENFKTHLEYIKKGLDKNDKDHDVMFGKIDDWIEKADKRFAPRWVADAFKVLIGTICLAVIGAVVTSVLK